MKNKKIVLYLSFVFIGIVLPLCIPLLYRVSENETVTVIFTVVFFVAALDCIVLGVSGLIRKPVSIFRAQVIVCGIIMFAAATVFVLDLIFGFLDGSNTNYNGLARKVILVLSFWINALCLILDLIAWRISENIKKHNMKKEQ